MGLYDTRYTFEYRLMPDLFYEQPKMLMGVLAEDAENFYKTWKAVCKEHQIEDPYKKEDFSVTAFQVSKDVKGFEVTLPEPEESPLCCAFYFICHKDNKKCAYYTVEKIEQGGAYFCSWRKEGGHINYGNCSLNHETNRNRCGEIF